MFFILSKTAAYFLQPSNFFLALLVIGLLLCLTPWKRLARWLVGLGIASLLAIGFLPIGAFLNYELENRFPVWDATHGPPDGIIVLGGAIDPRVSRARGQTALGGGAERVTIIAKLARDFPNARIVFSGGDASLSGTAGQEADYLYPLLETFGVPRERVMLERRARNTAENAEFTKALVQPKPGERWLLVTSAQHMPRAIGCFRRIGFAVEAYPVDWHTVPNQGFGLSQSFSGGLALTDGAVHEWLGLFVYWLTGRTGELLPGPRQAS